VSIAFQAGILRDNHFDGSSADMIAAHLKENVLMEGKDFRAKVYKNGGSEFDQEAFDKIWPHLRVLARSSPDDKLTLAHGLNKSCLFENKEECRDLLKDHGIRIFPDRQVVAMTGELSIYINDCLSKIVTYYTITVSQIGDGIFLQAMVQMMPLLLNELTLVLQWVLPELK
jgi:hypothetical protein